MQRRPAGAKVKVRTAAAHFLMGACLGTLAALFLVIGNNAVVRELLAGGGSEQMSVAVFVCGFATMIAIGATFTGIIFAAIEDD
jgi:hypothetical protein